MPQRLAAPGIRCRTSRTGDCDDNAMMQSFFGTLKTEMAEPLTDPRHARAPVFDDIEVFDDRQRTHSLLDDKSPAGSEQNTRPPERPHPRATPSGEGQFVRTATNRAGRALCG